MRRQLNFEPPYYQLDRAAQPMCELLSIPIGGHYLPVVNRLSFYSVHPNFDIMETILPMFGLFLIPLFIWYFFNPPRIHPLVGIPAKSIFLIRTYILLKPSVASSLTFGTHNHYFIQPGKYSHLSSYVLYNPYLLSLFSLLETPCSRPSYI